MPTRKPVVLIADKLSQSTVDILGSEVEVRWVDGTDRAALLAAVPEADALLVRSATKVDKEVLDAGAELKIVGRAGVGLDNVDVETATEKGIMVANAPTSNIHSACEHALALMLATARQIPSADKSLRDGQWKRSKFKGVEIYGKVVGIVGFGHIGQLFAERLSAFGVDEIIAYDPYANPARAAQLGVELVSIKDLMERSDFVTIHLPKTPETERMFDRELLSCAKQGQIIINAARGGLVDEQALADAINEGRIRGAGFDVYATEPCTDSPLFALPETVVTPHLGASTFEAQDRAGRDVARSVLMALHGDLVPDAVNVPGGRPSREVSDWLNLSRKLGLIASAVLNKAPATVEIIARGEISHENIEPLGLSALRGIFARYVDGGVSFVNVAQIAKERGVTVSTYTEPQAQSYRSTLEVTVIAADGSKYSAKGALSGIDKEERIITLGRRPLDLHAVGKNIILRYQDHPGAIGKAGSRLGAKGINILAAAMSIDRDSAAATLMLRVDGDVSPETLEDCAEALKAEAYKIDLGR